MTEPSGSILHFQIGCFHFRPANPDASPDEYRLALNDSLQGLADLSDIAIEVPEYRATVGFHQDEAGTLNSDGVVVGQRMDTRLDFTLHLRPKRQQQLFPVPDTHPETLHVHVRYAFLAPLAIVSAVSDRQHHRDTLQASRSCGSTCTTHCRKAAP